MALKHEKKAHKENGRRPFKGWPCTRNRTLFRAKGRCFDADLLMKDDGERVNYSLDFSSKSTAKRKTKG